MFELRSRLALASGLLLTLLAVPAGAAPAPFTGSLTILIGGLPPVVATASGTGTSAGVGGAASIPAGVFAIASTGPIVPPLLVIDGFGVGVPGQGGTGQLPLNPGTNKALSFNGTTGTMGLSLSGYFITGFVGPTPNVAAAVPLAIVGVGGTQKVSFGGGLVMFTVVANPYQLGMVTVMGALQGVPTTVMGTGYDNRGVSGGLAGLQLVSPTIVSMGAVGSFPAIAILTFVPEPTTFVLVGAGLAMLAGLRRVYTVR